MLDLWGDFYLSFIVRISPKNSMGVRKDAALCGEYRMGVYDAPSPERNETRQQVLLQPLWHEKRGSG